MRGARPVRLRPAGCDVRQRRHPARPGVVEHHGRGFRRGHRHPSPRQFHLRPRGHAAFPRAARRGAHHPDGLDRRAARQFRADGVFRCQIRHRRLRPHLVDGVRQGRRHRQRHRAQCPDPHGRDHARCSPKPLRPPNGASPCRPSCASAWAWERRRTWRRSSSSSPPTRSAGITGQCIGIGGDKLALWAHPQEVSAAYPRPAAGRPEAIADAWGKDVAQELQTVGIDFET